MLQRIIIRLLRVYVVDVSRVGSLSPHALRGQKIKVNSTYLSSIPSQKLHLPCEMAMAM